MPLLLFRALLCADDFPVTLHEESGTGLGCRFARSVQVQDRYFGIVGPELLCISVDSSASPTWHGYEPRFNACSMLWGIGLGLSSPLVSSITR